VVSQDRSFASFLSLRRLIDSPFLAVVNVLQPHPRLPLVAISGIDPTVKIFGPTTDLEHRGNLVEKAEGIIARNRSQEGRESGNIMSVRCWSSRCVLF
jgi:hypothetical protein